MDLIPKDTIYCSRMQLEEFTKLLVEESTLLQVFDSLQSDKEEVWFDIYRSIANAQDSTE